jgi:iron(III) transport system substrate-binding protein
MHAAALFERWGEERAVRFFDDFTRHGGTMLASNGEVRRRVAAGEFAFGLTDSDDVSVALRDGKPVGWVLPDQGADGDGAVVIPCVAVGIEGAPHPEHARRLVEFLASEQVERFMACSEAAHFPVRAGQAGPEPFGVALAGVKAMPLDWPALARREQELQRGFLKQWVERQQR